MVTTGASDAAFLASFVQSPTTVSAEQAASRVRHIIAAAASPSGATPASVQVAKQALQQFFKSPSHTIISHLLPACEDHVSCHLLDVFILSTAAWKAVTAAALQSVGEGTVDAATSLRILGFAIRSALSMLLRAVSVSKSPSGGEDVVRHVKIAKFYSLNAMRCAKAFSTNIAIHAQLHECFSEVVMMALRIVGVLSYILLMQPPSMCTVWQELKNEIAPLIAGTFRSVLVLLRSLFDGDVISESISLVAKCVKEFSNSAAFEVDGCTPVRPPLLRTFGVLHFMRYAACDNNLSDSGNNEDMTVLRALFHPVFCPALFASLDMNYESFLTLREPTSHTPLIQTVSQVAAECLAIVNIHGGPKNCEVGVFENALLGEMSAVNPLRAYVAAETLVKIFEGLHPWSERYVQLLITVLSCARVSYTLDSEHADCRWLNLATRLAILCVQEEGLLLYALVVSRAESTTRCEKRICLSDAFALRIVAAVCELVTTRKQGNGGADITQLSMDSSHDITTVLQALKLERSALQTFVKKCLTDGSGESELTVIALLLLPHTFDSMSASTLLVNFIKRDTGAFFFNTALNMLQPSCMQPESMKESFQASSNAVKKHGLLVCACVAAFMSRWVHDSRKNAHSMDMTSLSGLLQEVINAVQRENGQTNTPDQAALRGATLHHAAQILSRCGSIYQNNQSLKLAHAQLSVVEDAHARWQLFEQLKKDEHGSTRDLDKEHDLIAAEKVFACRRGDRNAMPLSRNDSSVLENVRCARESLVQVLASICKNGPAGAHRRDDIVSEIESLRYMITCASRWSEGKA